MNMSWGDQMISLALLPREIWLLHSVMFNEIVAESFAIFVVKTISPLMLLLLMVLMMRLLLKMVLGSA